MASRMAALAAVKPKRCHGVKSTKLASSMTENLWVCNMVVVVVLLGASSSRSIL